MAKRRSSLIKMWLRDGTFYPHYLLGKGAFFLSCQRIHSYSEAEGAQHWLYPLVGMGFSRGSIFSLWGPRGRHRATEREPPPGGSH